MKQTANRVGGSGPQNKRRSVAEILPAFAEYEETMNGRETGSGAGCENSSMSVEFHIFASRGGSILEMPGNKKNATVVIHHDASSRVNRIPLKENAEIVVHGNNDFEEHLPPFRMGHERHFGSSEPGS